MDGPVASLSSADGYAQADTQERAGRVGSPPSEHMAGHSRQVSWLTVCALRVLHLPAVEQWRIEGFKTVYSCGGSQGIDPVPS